MIMTMIFQVSSLSGGSSSPAGQVGGGINLPQGISIHRYLFVFWRIFDIRALVCIQWWRSRCWRCSWRQCSERNRRSIFLEASQSAESTPTLRLWRKTSPEGGFCHHNHHHNHPHHHRHHHHNHQKSSSDQNLPPLWWVVVEVCQQVRVGGWGELILQGSIIVIIIVVVIIMRPSILILVSYLLFRGQYSTSPSGRGRVMMNRWESLEDQNLNIMTFNDDHAQC